MSETYSRRDLARWGVLDLVRREAVRDRLIASVAMPPASVFEVLLSQWSAAQGLMSQAALDRWLEQRGLSPGDLPALVSRSWRWQQWCEREGSSGLNSRFLDRKGGLDQVTFWRLLCSDHELIAELHQRLRGEETGFEQLAEQAQASRGLFAVEHVGPVALEELSPPLAALLRVSEVGVIWAPRPASAGEWQIVLLEQRHPAALNPTLRGRLLEELGEARLAEALKETESHANAEAEL